MDGAVVAVSIEIWVGIYLASNFSSTILPSTSDGAIGDAVRFAPRTTDDGNESFRGQMEVSVDGQWAGICNISSATASVLCRQLHCAGGGIFQLASCV